MNETNETTTTNVNAKPVYRPRLALFHPNGKGSGCAVQLELHPAHGQSEGSIMLSAAKQLTIGDRRGPVPTFPRFDWENKVTVKLSFSDLSKILQVMRGETESLENGKGLYHGSANSATRIGFRHLIEPIPGYALELNRTRKDGEESRMNFIFNNAEALGLCESIAGSMSVIAFGIPLVLS